MHEYAMMVFGQLPLNNKIYRNVLICSWWGIEHDNIQYSGSIIVHFTSTSHPFLDSTFYSHVTNS